MNNNIKKSIISFIILVFCKLLLYTLFKKNICILPRIFALAGTHTIFRIYYLKLFLHFYFFTTKRSQVCHVDCPDFVNDVLTFQITHHVLIRY